MISSLVAFLVSVGAFAVLLPLVVFIHEYGHFKTARLCGVRIDVFSIGFGPALKQWTDRHGTVWKIAAIPLGGFVKFFGDANAASAGAQTAEGDEHHPMTTQFGSEKERLGAQLTEEEKRVCFHFKPVWQRALIVAAGPFANFALAIAIFTVIFASIGTSYLKPVVGSVQEESAAAEAGFQAGDEILAINGRRVAQFSDMQMRVSIASDEELTFLVDRAGEEITLVATPRRTVRTDDFGNEVKIGVLGIRGDGEYLEWRRYGPIEAVGAGVGKVWQVVEITGRFLSRLVTLQEDPRQLGGPVTMAKYAGQSVMTGFDERLEVGMGDRVLTSVISFVQFAAFVSVSIGFLNLLPVPVLDGGHLLYYAYEAIAGRPLSDQVQGVGFRIGLVVVGSLIVFVVVNDVFQLVSSGLPVASPQ